LSRSAIVAGLFAIFAVTSFITGTGLVFVTSFITGSDSGS